MQLTATVYLSYLCSDTDHTFTANESDWGFSSFFPLEELMDPAKVRHLDGRPQWTVAAAMTASYFGRGIDCRWWDCACSCATCVRMRTARHWRGEQHRHNTRAEAMSVRKSCGWVVKMGQRMPSAVMVGGPHYITCLHLG